MLFVSLNNQAAHRSIFSAPAWIEHTEKFGKDIEGERARLPYFSVIRGADDRSNIYSLKGAASALSTRTVTVPCFQFDVLGLRLAFSLPLAPPLSLPTLAAQLDENSERDTLC
jgi:hypothetical protein